MIAAHHQHMAEVALVRVTAPGRQPVPQAGRRGPPNGAVDVLVDRPVHAQVVEQQLAAVHRAGAGEQAPVHTDKGNGAVGAQHRAGRGAGIRVEAGGHVQGQHRLAETAQRFDQRADIVAQGVADAGAEQAVHQQRRVDRQIVHGQRPHRHAGIAGAPRHGQGVALHSLRVAQMVDHRLQAGFAGQPRHHIAVAAVVAAAAQHRRTRHVRPARQQHIERRAAGALHQFLTAKAGLTGQTVQFAGLIGAVQRLGQRSNRHSLLSLRFGSPNWLTDTISPTWLPWISAT